MRTSRITGEGKHATTPPVTWRNRHRRAPKNKAPITRAEALAHARKLEAKYRSLANKQRSREHTPTQSKPSEWESDRFIEETVHARLRGDIAQAFLRIIERISDAEPQSQKHASIEARRLSKTGYGRLRAKEAMLDAATPDHVSKWDGDFPMKSGEHYMVLGNLCGRLANLISAIAPHSESMAA
jgi:hypothetical protein